MEEARDEEIEMQEIPEEEEEQEEEAEETEEKGATENTPTVAVKTHSKWTLKACCLSGVRTLLESIWIYKQKYKAFKILEKYNCWRKPMKVIVSNYSINHVQTNGF